MSTRFSLSMEMSRLTRGGTAEPVSRDQILRHARGQGNIIFPCSADHEQDWQPYPVGPYSAICDDHIYTHTYRQVNTYGIGCDLGPFWQKGEITGVPCTGADEATGERT